MSNFWAKFYEPLPSAPLKPNNASAIFGGQSPYGLRAAEPSVFRPKDPTKNKQTKTRKKVGRSHSDVGISKSGEKRKPREPVVKRKVSESKNNQNSENGRSVTPRKGSEKNSEGDSPDGEDNGDRYPLFIPVIKPSEDKPRKPSNGDNQSNGTSTRRSSESSPKTTTAKTKTVDSQKSANAKNSGSPFDSLRREKTDFIIRPRKSPNDTGSPNTAFKREKSDITLKRSQSPSGVAKPRGSASPASLRRGKSDITLKRSHPPGNLTREKSDLVRPRGSALPGPLRREKSDITATKRSQSPAGAVTTTKTRGSASPGSLRREKSDITATKRSQSPAGAVTTTKTRGSASPGSLRREKSDITAKPPSITREKSDLVKPRGSTSPASPKREKSDVTKKPPKSPSKSNLPKPRVSASVKPAARDSQTVSSDDQRPHSTTSSTSSLTEQPSKENSSAKSGSVSEVGKDKDELTKATVSSVTVESPKQNVYHCDISTKQSQKTNLKAEEQETDSDILVNNSSSETSNKSEVNKPENCTSPEPVNVEELQRVSSPGKTQDCDLLSNSTSSAVTESQLDINNCSRTNNIAEMSKIPTPASTQVSRIPSLTKSSTPPSRIPPKSKIPSFSKSDEEPKKSHIPTGIPTIGDKPASKLPSLQRADPAKENKDPALNDVDEVNKQNSKISHIPSATKSGIPAVSRIPSIGHKESQDKTTEGEVETPKSRIPSISSSQPSATTTPVSKIPSFSKKHSLTNTPSKEEPESKIPHLGATTPKTSGIPKPEVTPTGISKPETKHAVTESRIPHLPGSTPKESGIPKPEVSLSGIPKPEVSVSGIPKPQTPTTPTESKIPQFSTPRSKIPAPHGSVLSRKDSEERIKKQKLEEASQLNGTEKVGEPAKLELQSVEEPKKAAPSPAKVPPPPPPRQDVNQEQPDDLPMDEDIFAEAKRMEELLRNESIIVQVPVNENEATKDITAKGDVSKLVFQTAPAAVEMVDQTVHVSESTNNNTKETTEKKEQFSFKTFGKREDVVKDVTTTETVSTTTMSLGLTKQEEEKVKEDKESISEAASPVEQTPAAIDTLGQYEQQSRRSRSRQRKIISPDSEDANKTFEDATSEEIENKAQETTTKTEETETKTKSSKSKGKHDKPKFVIESSLGADFYQSKSSQSKDSIAEEAKPKEVVVIQNKAFDDTKGIPKTDIKPSEKTEHATNKDSTAFEDVELSSNRGSKVEMRAWSMEDLDEKTVKCSCGRGGKCSIM